MAVRRAVFLTAFLLVPVLAFAQRYDNGNGDGTDRRRQWRRASRRDGDIEESRSAGSLLRRHRCQWDLPRLESPARDV